MSVCYTAGRNAQHYYGPSVVPMPKEPKELNGPQAINNYQINKKQMEVV